MKSDRTVVEAFTEISSRYEEVVDSELNRFWGWSYRAFVDRLLETVPIKGDQAVLDVATGTAAIPLELMRRGDLRRRITGIDITPGMLVNAKAKLIADGAEGRTDLACGSAMAMPFEGEVFDVVICALATHHMDLPQALSEMVRVLREDGILTIADVGGADWWGNLIVEAVLSGGTFLYFLFQEGFARAKIEARALKNIKSQKAWASLLAELGLKNVEITKLTRSRSWIPAPIIIQATR